MSTTINWLHLTDWHVGQTGQGHLWPNLRAEFERDLNTLIDQNGPIDIVFVTGDLVQSGTRSEYGQLETHLAKLWEYFDTKGFSPKLVTVPGNHDLRRPDSSKSWVLALRSWERDSEVRETFWNQPKSDFRKQIEKVFEEYLRWQTTSKIPALPTVRGLLPGDLSAIFTKNGYRIGVAGFNTTFLQLERGDFEKRLAISARQFDRMCGTDYADWFGQNHISVLLTHQPKNWLCESSRGEFESEIAPNGRFHLQLSGHLHQSKTSLLSEGGSTASLIHQGASIFGLEFIGEQRSEVRTHGYLFGQWSISGDTFDTVLFPRIAIKKQGGALGLAPDHSHYLGKDNAVHFAQTLVSVTPNAPLPEDGPTNPLDAGVVSGTSSLFLESGLFNNTAALKGRLSRAPRFVPTPQLHTLSVRGDERQALLQALKEKRAAWIMADWGTGEDAFIASVLRADEVAQEDGLALSDNVFHLRCDTFESVGDIEQGFRPQFGITAQEFLECFVSETVGCLVLDGILPAITEGVNRERLISLCELMLDFAPNLSLVFVSRSPLHSFIPEIPVRPLDLPDLRAYVQNHPHSQPDLLLPDVLERLFEASGGLPVHVDRMLERLRVASLEAVLDEEHGLVETLANEAPLHKALKQAIEAVRKQDVENGSRALSLMKALAILPYGEMIERLKHFFPTRPFYPRDAELLYEAALIDSIPLHQSSAVISSGAKVGTRVAGAKVLRVPKQVRDCVLGDLTNDDKSELIEAAGNFFFGDGWRVGKKARLRKMPSEYRDYLAHGVGNEFAVLKMMISRARETDDLVALKKCAKLALHYCGILRKSSRNRDLRLVSQGLLVLLESTELDNDIAELHRFCGRACRLTDHDTEAVEHFRTYLDYARGRASHDSVGFAMLELTDALRSTGDVDGAKETANRLATLAKPASQLESQARAKLVSFDPESEERTRKVATMEEHARAKNWTSLANDLALSVCYDSREKNKKFELLDKVLGSEQTGWNRHRAIIEKAILAVRNAAPSKLSTRDRLDLQQAYTYCHSQRLALFNRCHEAIWSLIEQEGNREQLYKLFWHSSFLWRIRGEEEIEVKYFEKLRSLTQETEVDEPKSILVELRYFTKRAVILLGRLVSGKV